MRFDFYLPWPRRLGGRAVLVLLAAVVLVHLGSVVIHDEGSSDYSHEVATAQVAGRLVTAARALSSIEPVQRDAAAHSMTSSSLVLHWEDTPAVQANATPADLLELRSTMLSLAPGLDQFDLRLGTKTDKEAGPDRAFFGTLGLSDGSHLNFSAYLTERTTARDHAALISTSLITLVVGILANFLMVRLTSPLKRLAAAADSIGRGPGVSVEESGPEEIRRLAQSFNAMQARIHALIADRTYALAAVSHDLRTPITRLRLRAGFIPDEDTQQAVDADLDEMEAMIEATLQFLRGSEETEEPQRIDLAALLTTLIDEASDAGSHAEYSGPAHMTLPVRALAIKRALTNLIRNAIVHGGSVHVDLRIDDKGRALIAFSDRGPGIPEHALERVFEPFERLEESRNRSLGGVGLGLSIAKQAVEREGGTIRLRNSQEGGLVAEVVLPDASGTPHTLSHAVQAS